MSTHQTEIRPCKIRPLDDRVKNRTDRTSIIDEIDKYVLGSRRGRCVGRSSDRSPIRNYPPLVEHVPVGASAGDSNEKHCDQDHCSAAPTPSISSRLFVHWITGARKGPSEARGAVSHLSLGGSITPAFRSARHSNICPRKTDAESTGTWLTGDHRPRMSCIPYHLLCKPARKTRRLPEAALEARDWRQRPTRRGLKRSNAWT